MSPSVATLDYGHDTHHHDHDQDPSPRPQKRPRKTRDPSPKPAQDADSGPFLNTAPLDHIFITDGIISKKPGGKKAPLSCCECRRLKLKCDRNFPCASCKKRGCAEICPDGVLVSGRGTRFILANTEQLHTKIQEMSERIRQLEDALQGLHSEQHALTASTSDHDQHHQPVPVHPLMTPELLMIKSTMGLYNGAATAGNAAQASQQGQAGVAGLEEHLDVATTPIPGGEGQTMAMDTTSDHSPGPSENNGPNGASSSSSGNLRLQHGQVQIHQTRASGSGSSSSTSPPPHHSHRSHQTESDLQAEIVRLSHTFPLSPTLSPNPNPTLREYIRAQLPPRAEADYLWDQARQNALWQYNPHPSSTFYPNLAYHCYTSPLSSLSPRRLALLFMILAVGCLVDLKREPDHPDAERYHQLARAGLCEVGVMEDVNVETITALFYEIWYLVVFSDKKKAAGYAWGIMGLTAKLAQSIGLHRNTGKGKVIPEELEMRRSLFWELLYLDGRLSLSLGRPPSLSIHQMDCPLPTYTPDDSSDAMDGVHQYQQWKHSCYIHCLAPVLDAIYQPQLNYDVVLELDKKIRDFSIPPLLRGSQHTSRSVIMQKASLSTALEAVLLQLHRQFFTRALSSPDEAFNRRHKYAPSVVAVFLSASRMIATVQDLYTHEPHLAARILGYWSNAFSATVALCILVSRAPFTCLSPAALQELERARLLFRAAKDTCPRALQVIPVLETMIDKANDIYNRWSNGQEVPTIVLRHITEDVSFDYTDAHSTPSPLLSASTLVPSGTTGSPQTSPGEVSASAYGMTQYSSSQQQQQQQQVDSFSRSHRSLAQCVAEVHARARALFPMRKPCECSSAVTKPCPPSHSWSPPPKVQGASTPVLPPELPRTIVLGGAGSSGSRYEQQQQNGNGYNQVQVHDQQAMFHQQQQQQNVYGRHSHLQQQPAPSPRYQSHTQGFYSTPLFGEGLYTNNVLPGNGPAIPAPPPPQPATTLSPTSKMAVVDTINFEVGALNSTTEQPWMAFF